MAARYATIPTDKLCFVVGVTGHREIAAGDEAPLRSAFRGVLQEVAAECPHMPLVVLSGLAAGADSLAAEEAIAQNVPVIACLPMPAAEYEADFSPGDLARFRSLLASCARVVVTSPHRENGYVATGLFVTHYSHLLVAFWDGSTSRGAGGTADVLSTRLTGEDAAPAYRIVTPRLGAPRPDNVFEVLRLFPKRYRHDVSSETAFHAILGRMDRFNVDLEETGFAEQTGDSLRNLMERTDATANRLQRHTNFFQAILYGCAFIGAAFQILAQLPAFVKLAAILAAFLAYRVARKNDFENRYQDYRGLAEALRVQDAWYCAGLTQALADRSYLRMQESELQWIRMALRALYLTCCVGHEPELASPAHPGCRGWVRSQWRYYYRAGRRETELARFLQRVALVAIVIGLAATLVSAALLLPAWLHQTWWAVPPGNPGRIVAAALTVPFAIAATLAALVTHYLERRNILTNARRYERMFHVFDNARRQLMRNGNDGRRASEILLSLGRAALVEHGDWLIMRRDRPIKIVVL